MTCCHSLGNKMGDYHYLQTDSLNIYCKDGSVVVATLSQRETDRAVPMAVSGLFSSLKVTSGPRRVSGDRGGGQECHPGGGEAGAGTVARAAQEVATGSLFTGLEQRWREAPRKKRWLPLRWVYLPARWEVCDQPL